MQLQSLTAFTWLLAHTVSFVTAVPALSSDIGSSLGPQLSPGAAIYTSNSNQFSNQSARWTTWSAPSFNAVVEPATEQDVVKTINYAVSNNIGFLAQGGGHGYSGTLAIIQNAIMINLKQFDHATFNEEDNTVTVGGGTLFSTVVNVTHAAGREFTVGSGPCVGIIGAALSGGHGRLQGKWGLTQDALKSMRVVLANGTVLDVSASQNQDLWWAMRGAGQNFGVVISATFNTYPQTENGLHYDAELVLAGDKLESVFQLVNSLIPTWPAELAVDVLFAAPPDPAPLTPLVLISLIYAGPESDAQKYSYAFKDLGVTHFSENVYTWRDLPFKAADGSIAASCVKEHLRSTYSNNLASFNLTTQRAAFDGFATFLTQYPDARGTGHLWEIFGTQGVRAVPHMSSAYAHRQNVAVLGLLQFDYSDASITPALEDYGRYWREQYTATSGYDRLYVYPNYARGDEPLQALYGYDKHRLERLRKIKRVYDPKDVFKGYHDVLDAGEGEGGH